MFDLPTDVAEAARQCAGNWREFWSFAWFARPDDAEDYAVFNLSHRDSDPIDRVNAEVIRADLAQFPDHAWWETHSHWAVGHTDALVIRCLVDGNPTTAFAALHALFARIDDYPVLDDERLSEIERDELIEYITEYPYCGDMIDSPPDGWQHAVAEILFDDFGCYRYEDVTSDDLYVAIERAGLSATNYADGSPRLDDDGEPLPDPAQRGAVDANQQRFYWPPPPILP